MSSGMSGYLVRVGLDTSFDGGKGLGPVTSDGRFDYIPIPEQTASIESRTYGELNGRLGTSFSEYAGVDKDQIVHFDPEFETYTYGEVGLQKCRCLRKLDPGDLLVFYSGLEPAEGGDRPRIYAIGYFTVENVYDLETVPPERRGEIFEQYPNNAHVKREELTPERHHPRRERFPVIVVGDPGQSALLDRAVPLSSPTVSGTGKSWYSKYCPLATAIDVLGLNATDLTRSNPKKLRGERDEIRSWLDRDVRIETGRRHSTPKHYVDSSSEATDPGGRAKLRSYVVSTDSGFAPHSRYGLMSLATCKPMIRSAAKVGDWVVGVGGEDHGSGRDLVHAFRVEHIASMSQYYTDERYASRKPLEKTGNPRGDNIYTPRRVVEEIEKVDGSDLPPTADASPGTTYERGWVDGERCYTVTGGQYFQLAGGAHTLSHYKTDVEKQGDREKVLISSDYYYFGGAGIQIPEELAEIAVPGFGSHDQRRYHRTEPKRVDDFTPFVEWLRSNFRVGQHGSPASRDYQPDPSETTGPGC